MLISHISSLPVANPLARCVLSCTYPPAPTRSIIIISGRLLSFALLHSFLWKSPPKSPNTDTHSAPDKQSLVLDNADNEDSAEDHHKVIAADASPSELKTLSEQMPEKVDPKQDCSALLDNSNHIKHISGNVNADDLYALPSKRKLMQTTNGDATSTTTTTTSTTTVDDCCIGGGGVAGGHQVNESTSADEDDADNEEKGKEEEVEDKDASKDLPPGWEKHEGEWSVEVHR